MPKMRQVDYNQFHNILRLLDALPNFPFTASETNIAYKHGIYELLTSCQTA